MACHAPQPELQLMFVKQDLPFLLNGSATQTPVPSGAEAFPASWG